MKLVHKIIYKIGARLRNKGLWQEAKNLESSDFSTKEDLKEFKLYKLNLLLRHAVKFSKYYKRELAGVDHVSHIDDLRQLPILNKKALIEYNSEIGNKGLNEKYFLAETSGSTGQALKFYKNQTWDTKNRASLIRAYSWFHVNPWERNGYFWGYNFSSKSKLKIELLDIAQNRFRLFSYQKSDVEQFVHKLKKATYLHGYSSMIYEVALMAEKMGYTQADFLKLKMIKGTSEKIYPLYQSTVQKVFGKRIISEYGAAETGIIAFECPQGHMHINEENVIVEVVDGEIVVTNLNSFSFPIIRYKLGDGVIVAPFSICTCGRQSDVILEIEGRVGKVILGIEGKYPSLTLYYIFKNMALNHNVELQYQAFQNQKGMLEIRLPNSVSVSVETLIKMEAFNYFKEDIEISIVQNRIIHTKDGKLRDFITEL